MGIIKKLVTQSAADTRTEVAIDTGITSDGRTGWKLSSLLAIWANGATAVAADYTLIAQLQSESGAFTEVNDEVMGVARWGCQNTAGVAVAIPFEPIKQGSIIGLERVTVQPIIYLSVGSTVTAQANQVILVFEYEVVKLTDLEVLTLLYGGA